MSYTHGLCFVSQIYAQPMWNFLICHHCSLCYWKKRRNIIKCKKTWKLLVSVVTNDCIYFLAGQHPFTFILWRANLSILNKNKYNFCQFMPYKGNT